MSDKLLSLTEAIDRFVPDGSSIAIGLALEPMIPFAAGHEIIRQGRRNHQPEREGVLELVRRAEMGKVMVGYRLVVKDPAHYQVPLDRSLALRSQSQINSRAHSPLH